MQYLLKEYYFSQKLQNIWATFATKFVAKTFQNMPKQVTLTIRQFFKNL